MPHETSHVEELRWHVERFRFATPEAFEERRREPWFAKGRNHTTWEGGIQREVRDAGDTLAIEDEQAATLAALITGRTIVGFTREPDTGEDWSHGENSVTITLDDGSELHFMGTGYDASSLVTTYKPGDGS